MRASGYLAFVLGAMLVACAGQPQFGTFVSASEPAMRAVAADVVAGLQTTWPAHRHAMQILEPSDDQFARALAAELRRAGYRVFTEEGEPRAAIGVHFMVDTLGDTGLLRVTLTVQRGRWSRVYASVGGEVRPAGPWAVYTFRSSSGRGS